MSDILASEPQSAEEHLLERQHHRQPVHRRGEPARPARPPGPQLRRDVVQDLGAGGVRGLGHPDVEAGIVDQDDEVVAPHFEIIPEGSQEPVVGPDLGNDLDQPKGGEPFHPIPQRGAGLSHLRAPEGLDGGIGVACPECADHTGPVEIARRLASGDEDARRAPLNHQ